MMLHEENAAKAQSVSPAWARPTMRAVLQGLSGSTHMALGGVVGRVDWRLADSSEGSTPPRASSPHHTDTATAPIVISAPTAGEMT